ncbi:MAG: IS110 family transposase [Bacteroidota bacterium]
MNYTKFVGLDVHKSTISVAIAHPGIGQAEFLGSIPNTPQAIVSLVKKLGDPQRIKFCYEAGPCGYGLHRQLIQLGASCMVVAPSMIPTKPGEHIKTDRRDAKKLARLLRNNDLTPVWVPDKRQEALRDLLRARQDACADLLRKRNQLTKFLLRLGLTPPEKTKAWSVKYQRWIESIRLEEQSQQFVLQEYIYAIDYGKSRVILYEKEIEQAVLVLTDQQLLKALQALRGIQLITAATIIAEIGDLTRFRTASQLMAYAGLVPREHSSGDNRWLGKITKAGNSHIRFVTVETGWHYRHIPKVGQQLKKRQLELSDEIKAISWKAQNRLHRKYVTMVAKGKPKQKAVVAVGRELLGFIWSIAKQIEKERKVVA